MVETSSIGTEPRTVVCGVLLESEYTEAGVVNQVREPVGGIERARIGVGEQHVKTQGPLVPGDAAFEVADRQARPRVALERHYQFPSRGASGSDSPSTDRFPVIGSHTCFVAATKSPP
jgi:hypothetical protein